VETDISIITEFMVRTTYYEFQTSTKVISKKIIHLHASTNTHTHTHNILKTNHFYWPTNALNCIKLKG